MGPHFVPLIELVDSAKIKTRGNHATVLRSRRRFSIRTMTTKSVALTASCGTSPPNPSPRVVSRAARRRSDLSTGRPPLPPFLIFGPVAFPHPTARETVRPAHGWLRRRFPAVTLVGARRRAVAARVRGGGLAGYGRRPGRRRRPSGAIALGIC